MYSIVALFLGLLYPLAFAPFYWWPIAVLSLTGLAVLWLSPRADCPVRHGFCFGLGSFGAGIYWVYISLYTYGGAPLPFAILANILLVLYLSLYPALTGWLLRRLSTAGSCYRVFLIPLFWMLGELARAYILTGFPWLSAGYSQLFGPLHGLAPLGGQWLSGLVLIIFCALMAWAAVERSVYPAITAIFLAALCMASCQLRFTSAFGDPISAALVQGNASQYTKFDPQVMGADLTRYIKLSKERSETVIIWPETAIAFWQRQVQNDILEPLDSQFLAKNQTFVSGIPSGDINGAYYNSVITLGAGSGEYSKDHLLPFGEYIPFKSFLNIFKDYVDIPLSDFARGGKNQKPILTNGTPAAVNICFESAFGRDIRRGVNRGAQYIINVSNDGWFGNSIAAEQHLQMSQMRSLEMGRETARATNNGITAFIDSTGHVTARLPRFTAAVLSGGIQPRIGLTPYARYGNRIIAYLLALYAMIAALVFPFRNRNARHLSS